MLPDLRVSVEREVVRDQRQVRREQRLEPALQPPVDEQRLVAPEEAVVDEHELRARLAGPLEQLARARHAAGDLRHLVGADDLQAGTAVLRKGRDVEQFVGERDDVVSTGQRPRILRRNRFEGRLLAAARVEELDPVRDDLDRAAALALGVLPRAAAQPAVDADARALREVLAADLGLAVPRRDADEVGASRRGSARSTASRNVATFFSGPTSFSSTSVARLPIRFTLFNAASSFAMRTTVAAARDAET